MATIQNDAMFCLEKSAAPRGREKSRTLSAAIAMKLFRAERPHGHTVSEQRVNNQ
jgi:hypothetical protein